MEQRKRVLTDADITAIGKEVADKLPLCSLGFNSEEASIIKNHLVIWKKARNIIGTAILLSLVGIFLGILYKGFWVSLIEGIKNRG